MDKNMDDNKKYDKDRNIFDEEIILKIKEEVKKIQPELIEKIRELVSIYSIQTEPEEMLHLEKGLLRHWIKLWKYQKNWDLIQRI